MDAFWTINSVVSSDEDEDAFITAQQQQQTGS